MTNRFVVGALGGGAFGVRSSKPGFDVLTEALNSVNISFDSRLSDIGTVVASGLAVCGGSTVFFPTMSYVPVVQIFRWDGTNLHINDVHFQATSLDHWWLPTIALVTTNSLSLIPYTNPYYTTTSYFNPTGLSYLYSVFASG